MPKRSNEGFLKVRFCSLSALTIGLAVCLGGVTVPPAFGEGLVDTLKPWIEKNIRIANDKDGRPQLFTRTQNVVADIRFEDFNTALEARTAIAAFAGAFRLRHEFARANANLFVVSSRQIAEGKSPNRTLLRELGLPDSAIDIMTRTENWDSGCGVHDFATAMDAFR
jgi:hypothetical protein